MAAALPQAILFAIVHILNQVISFIHVNLFIEMLSAQKSFLIFAIRRRPIAGFWSPLEY
jgi:hypothetical protein